MKRWKDFVLVIAALLIILHTAQVKPFLDITTGYDRVMTSLGIHADPVNQYAIVYQLHKEGMKLGSEDEFFNHDIVNSIAQSYISDACGTDCIVEHVEYNEPTDEYLVTYYDHDDDQNYQFILYKVNVAGLYWVRFKENTGLY